MTAESESVPAVRQPARMMAFDSVEALQSRANNFYLMFVVMGEPMPDIYRKRPAFRRFAALYPERVTALEVALEADRRRPGEHSWPLLLEAYQLMSVLVDVTDRGVIPAPYLPYPEIDPDTGVDALYLTR
jgi:hypothetical protein